MTDTNATTDPIGDEPIPALLPRDWPRRLDEVLATVAAPSALRPALLALVDACVLTAVERDAADRDG